jgi:hypothetical protein
LFECKCGKTYKTKKGYENHIKKCPYADMDLDKVYFIGNIINDVFKFFEPNGREIVNLKRKLKNENISDKKLHEIALFNNIYKYRKMIWDIYLVWKENLLTLEYRPFLKWLKKKFKNINLINLKSLVTNTKLIFKFNFENLFSIIEERILDSIDFIKNKKFENNFEFIDYIINGDISIYYIIFNDYMATKWFENLDEDLQKELLKIVKQVENIIKDNLKPKEFSQLNKLANKITPIILNEDI